MNGCHRPKSETNDSLNANKMNNFPSFEVSSTSKSSKSGSESIQSKQILSMFNSLQCQLMTLQSTMVSLQMNQNAIQNTVEEVAKKVTKINSKVNSIQANIRLEDKETGDVGTESLIETEETDDCQRKEKKKRKKERTLMEEAIDKTVGEMSAISSAKKSRNAKKSTKSGLNGQCIDYNSHNDVSEQIELSNVSKIEKERKKSKSELVSVETNDKNEEIETSTPGWSVQYEQNRKKRKRSRKKKTQPKPEISAEVPPPPPPPQVVHMNLPRNQRPSNVKVKFESDSEEEGNTAAVNSASGDTSGKITPCSQAVTKPDTSTPKSFLSSTKPNTITPKSCPSSKKPETITPKSCPTSKKPETITPKSTKWTPPPGASNKNKRWMLRSLQVGNVLKHLRGEGDGTGEKETEESTEVAVNGDKSSPVSVSSPVHQNIMRKNSKPVLSLKKSLEKNGDVETFEAIPVSISEFSSFQDLHGPPRVGDRIAYKVIELSDTYSPEISAYKVADVISYDNQTGQVQLCLTEPTKVKQYPGKFDIPEIMETEESELQSENLNIEISYQELLEPKLIK